MPLNRPLHNKRDNKKAEKGQCSGRDSNPGSTARKADMLDRTTPPEHVYLWSF